MSKNKIIGLSIFGILLIFTFVLFSTYRSTYDRNIHLISAHKAQIGVIETNFDAMYKILNTNAQIPAQYAKDMRDLYVPLIEGRYSKGDGSLMKWVQERNPEFTPDLYKDLMESVEALRKDFELKQNDMLAIIQEHDNLRNEFWSHMFLGDVPALKYTLISSTHTKDVMKTGVEDDFKLFGNTPQ